MRYTWGQAHLFDTAAIPKAVMDQVNFHSLPQLKVLLWLACVGQGQWDADACAAACALSPATCEECLRYWVNNGVLATQGTASETAKPTKPPVAVADNTASLPKTTLSPLADTSFNGDRPSRTQVVQVKAEDTAFSMLLETAASKLGKILSPADMSTFLYLYRDLALPPEVILMVIGYAVQNGNGKMAYIEKTAIGWAEKGITTFEAAEEHVRHLEQCAQAWDTLSTWQGVEVARPTMAQKETARRWILQWNMPQEVVETVIAYTVEKTGKCQFSYADRVMERLHGLGIATADAAKAELVAEKATPKKKSSSARMKTANDRAPSYDMAAYEKMVRRHRPTPPGEE